MGRLEMGPQQASASRITHSKPTSTFRTCLLTKSKHSIRLYDGEEIGWHHAIELMDQETSRKMIAYATTAKKIRNVLNSNTGLSPRTRAHCQQTLAQNNDKV